MITITSGLAETQVLQRLGARGANLTLTVTSSLKNEPILVTISGKKRHLKGWKKRKVATTTGRSQEITLKDIPAGGPYKLTLHAGDHKASVKTFFVGDVWILAGQSNMQGCANMTGAAKPNARISMFTMRREWRNASEPLHICSESPDTCHSDGAQWTEEASENHRRNALKGVGPGLYFARIMLERTGVPQGLISTAHGGTSMAQWDPKLKSQGGGSLYGSMLLSARATGQPVSGILWYQGESDANDSAAAVYTDRMKELVAASRRDLKQPDLPWAIVQIGTVVGTRAEPPTAWNSVQDQQRLLPGVIKNLDVVTAIDLGMDDHIHIGEAGVPILGARLAEVAENLVHNKGRGLATPQPGRIYMSNVGMDQCIILEYKNVKGGLRSTGLPFGFTILSGKGEPLPHIFKTTLRGSEVILHLTQWLPDDTRVCYGQGYAPICNITDARGHGLPVMTPQRFEANAAWTPYLEDWTVSPIIENPVRPLDKLNATDLDFSAAQAKNYAAGAGFVNETAQWKGRSGHGYFLTHMDLPGAMEFELQMGYDGPFRLWIDDDAVHTDMAGINPMIRDQFAKKVKVSAGNHIIRVAMDLNEGKAWGYTLRMKSLGISKSKLTSGDYPRPTFHA